jgi:hypothetical protein
MKKFLIVALIMVGLAAVAVALWPREQQKQTTPASEIAGQRSRTETQTANHNHESMARVPAHYEAAPPLNTLRGTLAPEMFTGNVRLAYQVAKDIPETLAQLPCYCHCDMSQGHKSLHSCFEDEHGTNCGICIGEALMAQNLQRQGFSPTQIRERIVKAYGTRTDK